MGVRADSAAPEIYARLRAEVRDAGDDPEQLAALPYLDATVKEVMRLRPVIPLVGRVLQKPYTLCGYDLPAGTSVAACIYLTHLNPEVYPEPDAFRPERFLGVQPDPAAWLPFGGGIRRCVGAAFALYEMKIVLGTILASCDLELAEQRPRAHATPRDHVLAGGRNARAAAAQARAEQARERGIAGRHSVYLRRTAVPYALLACVAAGVRTLALWANRNSLLYRSGGLDAPQYLDMAHRFAIGQWPNDEPFFWAPGYPLFLGLLSRISESALWFKAVQIGLGTLTCILIGMVASRLFGNPRVSQLSVGIAAVYGPLVDYDLQISPASLDVCLSVLLLVLLLEAHSRRSLGLWVAAGVVAAAAVITRGAALLFLPLVLIWMVRDRPHAAGLRVFASALPPLAVLAPVVLALALVAAHNHRYDARHDPRAFVSPPAHASGEILISYNLGINFLLGNVPELYAANHVEHPLCFLNYKMNIYEPVLHGIWRPSAQSGFLLHKAVRFMTDHPVAWLRLMATKTAELVHGNEISRDTSIDGARVDNAVLDWLIWKRGVAFPSGLLIPLCLLGIAFAPKRSRQHVLILSALASQAVFVLAFFVTTRYRLALWTIAIPYAAYALVAAIGALRSWKRRGAFLAAGAAVALLVLSNHHLGQSPPHHAAFEYDHLGYVLDHAGQHDAAVRQWQSAVTIDPDYAAAHFQLAGHYAKQNDLTRAESHYVQGLRVAPMAFPVRLEYAKLLVRQARLGDAADQTRRVLSQLPNSTMHRTVCAFAARAQLDVGARCD